jgi:glycosyltransferase involved in cell wall biosynthesis
MTIWVFPRTGAYNGSLYDEVDKLDIKTLECDLSFSWALKKVEKNDILHLHWPSYRYVSKGSFFAISFAFLKFCLFCVILKLKRVRLWWTAHNLMPHEPCDFRIIDVWARHLVIYFCEKIFVHGKAAQDIMAQHFPVSSKKMVRTPHGHWIGHYGDLEPKESARQILDIPSDVKVFLLFGQLKPYKNIEGLIEAFRQLPFNDKFLLIAGKFGNSTYQRKIESIVSSSTDIKLDARFIADSEVANYLAASDAMCMPYNEILTSGTAMLSMSYGRPFISINKGYLAEVVNENSGILVDDIETDSLVDAMSKLNTKNWDEDLIIDHVSQFTFADAAAIFANEIKSKKVDCKFDINR